MSSKWKYPHNCDIPSAREGNMIVVYYEDSNLYKVLIYNDNAWRDRKGGDVYTIVNITAWKSFEPYRPKFTPIPYASHTMATWYGADKYVPEDTRNVLVYARGHLPVMGYYTGVCWNLAAGRPCTHKVEHWQYVRSTREI